jgi:N-acetylglucosaminyldiphosphoundecaprenol N-acetyl-beta-D-mannosaminyltransferase
MTLSALHRRPYRFLGIQVDALTISDLNALIAEMVQLNERSIIANHNLHSLYLYYHNVHMRIFYEHANYVHIDGMPLVLLGRILGFPLQREHRVTYADWVWPLMQEAEVQGWKIFYLGSKPGVADDGANVLRERFPSLQIATADGYFDATPNSADNRKLIDTINTYKPQILMVGMGMPRQEQWILDNYEKLKVNAILPSGACIDYVAGAVPTPPRWMGRLGIEWLHRLVSEPKRLWSRYLIEPWFVLLLFLKELWQQKLKSHKTTVES